MRKPSNVKVIIEKHRDGYVAYPIGMKGVVVGQGETFADAISDVRSALRFHSETFGIGSIYTNAAPREVFIAETEVY